MSTLLHIAVIVGVLLLLIVLAIVSVVLYLEGGEVSTTNPPDTVRKRGRPLKINHPPADIELTSLGKSSARIAAAVTDPTATVTFVTENLTIKPTVDLRAKGINPVCSDGGKDEKRRACGLFEIHAYFSVHNWTNSLLTVYDIHARLYHVSAGYTPLMMGYVRRYRVDLCEDNSIIQHNRVYRAAHGSAVYFDLVFETGFYDDTGTTLAVFGLEVDFELSGPEGVSKWRIPSEKIYVLQHEGRPYSDGTKVHIGGLDEAHIRKRYDEEKDKPQPVDTAAAQTMDLAVTYECLGKMFALHTGRGLNRIDAIDAIPTGV